MAFSWIATVHENSLLGEREILSTYAYPAIDSVQCLTETVALQTEGAPIVLSLDEVRELAKKPKHFDHGQVVKSSVQPARAIEVVLGAIFLGLSLVYTRPLVRHYVSIR